jgi:hypothetical protein
MADICFLITTYNRKESCQRLIDSLSGLGDIVVAHDGTDYSISGAMNLKAPTHHGRRDYWKIVNMLFAHRGIHKYYMMLPDDFIICNSQIAKAIEIWEGIDNPKKICLNLYTDRHGLRCWTDFYPKDNGDTWQTGWVDMCFLCEEMFFAQIGTLPKPHSSNNTNKGGSSGVGAYISRLLYRRKFAMYQVKESLAIPTIEHTKSQMHV